MIDREPAASATKSQHHPEEAPARRNQIGTTGLAQPSRRNQIDTGNEQDVHEELINIIEDRPQAQFRFVNINTKGVRRRANGDRFKILSIILAHVKRDGDKGFRCRHPANPALKDRNSVRAGFGSASDLAEQANEKMRPFSTRVDNYMAVTVVVALPRSLDSDEAWAKVDAWVASGKWTAGMPTEGIDTHRDQPGVPHTHYTLLPIRNGKRVEKFDPKSFQRSFAIMIKREFGLQADTAEARRERRAKKKAKKLKTAGDIAATAGAGPKNRKAAELRDAEFFGQIDPETGELRIKSEVRFPVAVAPWSANVWSNQVDETTLLKNAATASLKALNFAATWLHRPGHTHPQNTQPFHRSAPAFDAVGKNASDHALNAAHARIQALMEDNRRAKGALAVHVAARTAAEMAMLDHLDRSETSASVSGKESDTSAPAPAPATSISEGQRESVLRRQRSLIAGRRDVAELLPHLAGKGFVSIATVTGWGLPSWTRQDKVLGALEALVESGRADFRDPGLVVGHRREYRLTAKDSMPTTAAVIDIEVRDSDDDALAQLLAGGTWQTVPALIRSGMKGWSNGTKLRGALDRLVAAGRAERQKLPRRTAFEYRVLASKDKPTQPVPKPSKSIARQRGRVTASPVGAEALQAQLFPLSCI